MRELCQAPLGDKDGGYHALNMTDLSAMDLYASLQPPDHQAAVEQQKGELEETSWQQEALEKELNESRILLGDVQGQLKNVRARS
ncbi:hypothetical protein BHE74_00034138 [Ensete ventricosum]|nr:hypothetical protein BHE74_00034138 [Ensete ventricosum]